MIKFLLKAILIVLCLLILIPLVKLLIALVSWIFGGLELSGGGVNPWMILAFISLGIFLFFMVKIFND